MSSSRISDRTGSLLIPIAVVVGIILLIALPVMGSYNGLVNKEEDVEQAFGDLDSEYQRRADLIPNLSNAVKAALNQELAVFGEIARARANYAGARSQDDRVQGAGQLEGALGRLLVIMEQYPQLQSNQTVRDLMSQLESTENRVNQGRRTFNGAATEYNRSTRRFPGSIVAGIFGFDRRELFQAQAADREAPTVDLNTNTTTTAPASTATSTP